MHGLSNLPHACQSLIGSIMRSALSVELPRQ